ncbi:hypothetical protein D3C78_1320590 [compost metagenome]
MGQGGIHIRALGERVDRLQRKLLGIRRVVQAVECLDVLLVVGRAQGQGACGLVIRTQPPEVIALCHCADGTLVLPPAIARGQAQLGGELVGRAQRRLACERMRAIDVQPVLLVMGQGDVQLLAAIADIPAPGGVGGFG